MMTKTALVVVTKPHKVLRIVPKIKNYIKNTLYILLLSESKLQLTNVETTIANKKLGSGSRYSPSIIQLYKETLPFNLDVRILLSGLRDPVLPELKTRNQIEVVYTDGSAVNKNEVQKFVSRNVKNKVPELEVVEMVEPDDAVQQSTSESKDEKLYDSVVLGGTFDRLHTGHKILLSEAVLHCQKKITVGVTDTQMLRTKKLWELIEPVDVRIKKVLEFLQEIEPRLDYEVIPIDDMFGPTKDDPTFEMIVVSAETVRGSEKVNELRTKNGLRPLVVHSVPLLPENYKSDEVEEDKISSGNNRLRLLGTLLRPPPTRLNLLPKPYIIGLTGGIASGKSAISDYLGSLGATVISADKLGHEVYEVGKSGYQDVVNEFGRSICNKDGSINRKALGSIVFNDKQKLTKLNGIVWPAIAKLMNDRIAGIIPEKVKCPIVVFEAALLLQAEWNKYCHEVWTCIVPPEEALKRIQERDGIDEGQAKQRISSQISNFEQVQSANVVFCSLWTKAYTRKQVDRAWSDLRNRLPFHYNTKLNRHEDDFTKETAANKSKNTHS